MNIIVSQRVLAAGLKVIEHAVSKRATLPALSGVRLTATPSALKLEATDLEIFIEHVIEDFTCEQAGQVVLPCKLLKQIVEKCSAPSLRIQTHANGPVTIESGTRTMRLAALPAEDFPAMTTCDRAWLVTDANGLATILGRIALCASSDEARPVLTGIRLEAGEYLEVVATDSYRIGYMRADARIEQASDPALVPARLAMVIARVERKTDGQALVCRTDQAISITFGPTRYTSRLIDGDYPNWRQLIPARTDRALATFDAAELADAVQGIGVVAQTGTSMRVACKDSGIELTAGSLDLCEATQRLEEARFDSLGGEELTVAFNPAYVLDGLKFLDSSEIRMWARDGLKPAIFANGVPDECFYLLMPIRM